MSNMTSRERVRDVINHRIPDKIPNGLGGCETEGLHVYLYSKLQEVLGLPKNPPRLDTFMCNAVFEEDMINAIHGDIMLVASPRMCRSSLRSIGNESQWKEQEIWGRKFRVSVHEQFKTLDDGTVVWESAGGVICPPGGFFFDSKHPTDLNAEFLYSDPKDFNPPHHLDERFLRELEETAKHLYETTEYSLCLGETITDLQVAPGGMIGSMILMMEDPDLMREFLQKSLDSALAQLRELHQAVGKYIDILSIAHDFGDNKCVTIGENLWREIYKPYYKELFTKWHDITSMKVNMHSCGSNYAILPDLIECGMDIFNPVQISAKDMGASKLKKEFGDKLVFWGGGYDSQLFSHSDTYEEAYQKISDVISTFKPNGGYIFSGVHNLPADVPETHLKAIVDAYNDCCRY